MLASIRRHPWLSAAIALFSVFALAALVAASGVVSIRATNRHWAVTEVLLDYVKVRSVSTYSLGVDVPALDDDGLVRRGASHYEIGCAMCHGRPGMPLPPMPAGMTPPPPNLTTHAGRWTAAELFSIVKHGIKFTGMPAWPAVERDDEVWAVVAFLRRYPALDLETYRALAGTGPAGGTSPGPVTTEVSAVPMPAVVRDLCVRCHAVVGGPGVPAAYPRLAGQKLGYLEETLDAFVSGRRMSGTMQAAVGTLPAEVRREAAAYYASLAAPAIAVAVPTSDEAGSRIVHAGIPERNVPSCRHCHGPAAEARNAAYPRLAGQPAAYLEAQLRLLQARHRGGAGREHLMHVFVDRLRPEDIRSVAAYYAGLTVPPSR